MIARYDEEKARMRIFTHFPCAAKTILSTPANVFSDFNNL